ncbi:hypothetical protein H072_2274 [Dactylellina haptotyla CBS 200.50]|uniref:Alpha/beta hydrolase fold-3 domain-containing protein n=1 Tax=Dactylellina haptotyla (strain CBS 200.50) TaxID=1284197 RepID=S8ALF8_DACHA|nr:hypothetical protein H072_2274 [Dactylellina haptotyla CBS 200.50]
MRLLRLHSSVAPQVRLLSQYLSSRAISGSRNYSSPPYPAQFDRKLQHLYSKDYLDFYQKRLAGRPRYNPFDKGSQPAYPCAEDYQRTSPAAGNVACHDVVLPRKATGSIRLRIYNSTETNHRSPVIIYFPSRGTNPLPYSNEHHAIARLTQLARATIVSVGYRISPPFPLSLHDALAAVDWVRENVPIVSLEKHSEDYSGRLVAVLGTGLGGSLAASIGISEGRESGIIGIGAWAPIADWAFDPLPGIPESALSTLPKSPSHLLEHLLEFEEDPRNPTTSVSSLSELTESQLQDLGISHKMLSAFSDLADNPFLSTENLKRLRSRYLFNPEDFTDPFVSPLYWFSSTGVNIWTALLSTIEEARFSDPENPPAWIDTLPEDLFKRGSRRGKSYPPLHLLGNLTVPMMRIISADGDILHEQTKEFVRAARTSLFPTKIKTLAELEKEESDELELRFNNDKQHGNTREVPPTILAKVLEDHLEKSKELNEDGKPKEAALPYSKHAEAYIQHETIQNAAHCFMTSVGEVNDGMEEVEKMAKWLRYIFDLEPTRTKMWKTQKQEQEAERERQLQKRRRNRASKL